MTEVLDNNAIIDPAIIQEGTDEEQKELRLQNKFVFWVNVRGA
jgi:hypothetical protein